MTIKELSEKCNISEQQIQKRWKDIPGITKEKGELHIPTGTRYPFDAHRYRFTNIRKRRDALLKATYKNRFVDCEMLKMEKPEFDSMVDELVHEGYLRENGTDNQYGVNKYDTTITYDGMLTAGNQKKFSNALSTVKLARALV
ncbi:MAG: carotenoid oxygenase family protein [Clostridiales bacterium]|nr:carotenoid oxygenase family protein [Clostridiales bacterium]